MAAIKRRANTEFEPPKKRRLSKRTCTVCDIKKSSNQFPSASKVSSHEHGANVCRTCYMLHIEHEIDSKMWDQVACPECSIHLGYEKIKNMTSAAHFAKYDEAAFRAAISSDAEFRYCMSTTCKSGQGHSGGVDEPIFCCKACGHKHCVSCDVIWHEGQTCAQYQSPLRRAQEEEQSQKELEKISKPCPECRVPIQKNDGCDHMTCSRCAHQFCWICAADYRPILRSGNHHHNKSCNWYRARPAPRPVATPATPATPATV